MSPTTFPTVQPPAEPSAVIVNLTGPTPYGGGHQEFPPEGKLKVCLLEGWGRLTFRAVFG